MKLKKLVAVGPVNMLPGGRERCREYAEKVVFYDTQPRDAQEIAERVGDADGMLVSYNHLIGKEILSCCPNLRYVGMCCSLYSEESASVDIRYAREHGITVTGIRDYGDAGVAEYVLEELFPLLHGNHGWQPFFGEPSEITGLQVGILGMGTTGQVIAEAMRFFGADIGYYSRTRKPDLEREKGYQYQNLENLLQNSQVIFSCLSKNTVLLHAAEFSRMGSDKILFNTSLSPSFERSALEEWLKLPNTWLFCDTLMALGSEKLLENPRVRCMQKSAGMTRQAVIRLNEKVLENLKRYVDEN
ncbi:MAG: NAD(P)-dependent oxidoreductase [Candidatus Merdivicinus sp.]|jgi:lactate dehydrogenase-like 2-hydroxyacid dehydrogenase